MASASRSTARAPCFGYSFRQNELVSTLLLRAAPVSISLCIGAALMWLVGGVTVGTISALRPGSIGDRIGMIGSLAAVSLPIFFTGPLMLLVFEYKLKWLTDPQYVSVFSDPVGWLKSLILPWICLAFLFAALYARLTRSNMLEVMSEDYIRTARAKGLDRRTVVIKHGLRAALTPIVTIFGIDIGTLIGSTVITETVFNLRGLGYLSIHSISTQDLPVIMGVTLVAAVALVVSNVIVDILYSVIDPRVALAKETQMTSSTISAAPVEVADDFPQRPRSPRAFPHRRRARQERRRSVVRRRPRRDPRHRRRVGLRQVGDQPGDHGPAQGLACQDLGHDPVRRTRARLGERGGDAHAAWRPRWR